MRRINPSHPISLDALNAQFESLPLNGTGHTADNENEEDTELLDASLCCNNNNNNNATNTNESTCHAMGSESKLTVHSSAAVSMRPQAVAWLPCFYSVPANVSIASLDAYKSGMQRNESLVKM
jgi:hypothetical protein